MMMEPKNDCQVDHIKEAFDKLYNCVMPYIDLTQFADADTAFKELDRKVHSEIYILKKCLAQSDRAVDAGLTRSNVLQERISELENSRTGWRSRAQHAEKRVMELNKNISELEKELAETKQSAEIYHSSAHDIDKENDRLREVIDGKEKEINSLKKKIHELEQETADDTIRIESLEKANSVLRSGNGMLWSRIEEAEKENSALRTRNESLEKANSVLRRDEGDWKEWAKKLPAQFLAKQPWHGDGNAVTGGRTCCESLAEAIEFQSKKIEELEAEKTRLKEAYDIHETTIKKENIDLSPGHEFEFGDEVFVPWSDGPYMYVKSGLMYNPRTERLVYVGKTEHLKWFGEKFSIV